MVGTVGSAMLAAVLLAPGLGPKPEPFQGLAYSCDNTAKIGGNGCYAPGEPNRMTLAVRRMADGRAKVGGSWQDAKVPTGEPVGQRVKDPGTGVPVGILKCKTWDPHGRSCLVRLEDGREGWIGAAFLRTEAGSDIPDPLPAPARAKP